MLAFTRSALGVAESHGERTNTPSEKLKLMKSPLVPHEDTNIDEPNFTGFGDRYTSKTPEFKRHGEATMLEVFFDLFFAANYTVFSKTQSVTSAARIGAYIGYFSLMWFTWLAVALYDVRFVTDSIFERTARAIHLGVMVGFAVVAPNFKPEEQDQSNLQTMSLILMVSRFCLAAEYGSIIWHVRKFKKVRLAFFVQISVHLVVAMIFLGISFRFKHQHSKVFITWYLVCGIETLMSFALALYCHVLSLTKTHLMNRMSLLTIIILGDGIVVLAEKVVTIVKSAEAWNPIIIGVVIASSSTTYFIFLIYFDWMRSRHLPAIRQVLWSLLHFPFHLAMVLFMQGFTQFILWTKIVDVLTNLRANWIINDIDALSHATSAVVQANITTEVSQFFTEFTLKYDVVMDTIQTALENITAIPDNYWPQLAKFLNTRNENDFPSQNTTDYFFHILRILSFSMENSVFSTYDIDLTKEHLDQGQNVNATLDVQAGGFESSINTESWQRYQLVFFYGYLASGACLALMTALKIVPRQTPWKAWPMARTIINGLLAVGVGLVALLVLNDGLMENYLFSPWPLPTICLVWLVVLALTHTHSAPPLFFKRSATFPRRRTAERISC